MITGKLDIDSSEFDPNEYFIHLLKNNNLKQLVDKNLDIQSQIKSFDHDIQSMVSDNYSKFISSIDIVKKMKESIQGVEKKMEKLEKSITRINDLAVKVDSTLETKRTEIKKLDLINKDLSGLRKLCEFPELLKKELDEYKSKLKGILNEFGKKKISPLDFPKEVLNKLNLRFLFRESAEYYLDCWDKLMKYRNESLIRPLYEESKIYITEIKNILYALVFNKKNSGDEHRMILYNYLCFEKDRASILKSFYRNLADQYVTKLRKLFYSLDKYGGRLNEREFEIELEEDGENISVRPEGMIQDSIQLMIQMHSNQEDFSVYGKFRKIKEELVKMYEGELEKKNALSEIDTVLTMLRSDIQFVVNKLGGIFDKSNVKILHTNFILLLRTVFEDISRRLSGIKPPFTLHRIIFKKFNSGFNSISHLVEESSYKGIFESLLKRFELEMLWICELSSLKDILVSFTRAKSKVHNLYLKTQKNIVEMESHSKQLDIFELNFDREISNQAKMITQTVLLSSINYMLDIQTVANNAENDLNSWLSRLYKDYWILIKSFLMHFGQNLNEDHLIESPKTILLNIESVSGDDRVSKSKILSLVRNKVYYSLLEDLKKIRTSKNSLFTIILLTKVFSEIKGVSFGAPLVESYEGRKELFSDVFAEIAGEFEYENIETVKRFSEFVRGYFSKSFKTYLRKYIKNKKTEVQVISKEIEPLIIELKLVVSSIYMIFSEEEKNFARKKAPIYESKSLYLKPKETSSVETNILLAKQSKIIESELHYTTQVYINAVYKSIMRTVLREIRKEKFTLNQARQVQVDLTLLCELLNEVTEKDEDMIMSGFYFEMINCLELRCFEEGELIGQSLLDTLVKSKRQNLPFVGN